LSAPCFVWKTDRLVRVGYTKGSQRLDVSEKPAGSEPSFCEPTVFGNGWRRTLWPPPDFTRRGRAGFPTSYFTPPAHRYEADTGTGPLAGANITVSAPMSVSVEDTTTKEWLMLKCLRPLFMSFDLVLSGGNNHFRWFERYQFWRSRLLWRLQSLQPPSRA